MIVKCGMCGKDEEIAEMPPPGMTFLCGACVRQIDAACKAKGIELEFRPVEGSSIPEIKAPERRVKCPHRGKDFDRDLAPGEDEQIQ